MEYQGKVLEVISSIKNFDKVDFEIWLTKNILSIGSNNVFQYLDEKKRWNTQVIVKEDNKTLVVDFSPQSQLIIENLTDFDYEDCKRWFLNSVTIGLDLLLTYLAFKRREVKPNGNSK